MLLIPSSILNPIGKIEAGEAALLVGFSVLVLDAVAPVPSSAVMIALGGLAGFGAAAAVSVLGLVGGAVVGYGIGYAGSQVIPWGGDEPPAWTTGSNRRAIVAVIASRSIPFVAETTAVTAGAVRMRLGHFVPSTFLGALAPAVVYAAIGSGLTSAPSSWLIASSTVVVVAIAVAVHRLLVARP